MLGLNFSEVVVIVVVLIIVVGPERLPAMMKQVGRYYGQLKRMSDEFRRAFMLEADREEAEERAKQFRKRREEARRIAEDAARQATPANGAPSGAVPLPAGGLDPAPPNGSTVAAEASPETQKRLGAENTLDHHLTDPDVATFLPNEGPARDPTKGPDEEPRG
jgi:sec-independent protein translocase protein TatB